MYCLFGNKWLNLHGGPVWKVECIEQDGHMASTDTKQGTNVIYFISIPVTIFRITYVLKHRLGSIFLYHLVLFSGILLLVDLWLDQVYRYIVMLTCV